MSYEFRLPDIGEGVAEGEVVEWFVNEGDSIKEDAPLVSVLTDKANVEIPSPKAGKVVKLHAKVGEKVKVGGVLVSIETGDAGPAPVGTPPPSATPAAPSIAPSASPRAATATGETPARILATPAIRRLAAERGLDLASVSGTGPGGRITEADLGSIGAGLTAGKTPELSKAEPAEKEPPRPLPSVSVHAASPAGSMDPVERIPLRGVRRVIAEHMTEATHRAAHFTYVEEVDVTELVHLHDRMSKHVEKLGVKLSYLPFIIKGVVTGLRAYPRMNATMDDAQQELLVHSAYNIGIATAAPEGLVVPVIHHADARSLTDLAKAIQDLSERGRSGKLTRAEMSGGTFTITSLGALGGLLATPILNYPEVAILGVHKIAKRPVYRADGTIGPAEMMNLSVSLDHRVLDGIVAAQFIAVVKSFLEEPHQLFAELA